MYHWSLILRSFRAKPKLIEDDANGFVKALYQFSDLWILDLLSKTLAHAQKRDCVTLKLRSFGIRIRISDPRSLRSWRTKRTEFWFVTYGKIARTQQEVVKQTSKLYPVIKSQAMLQNKGFHLGCCMHEYSVEFTRQFCGKTETKFCPTHSNICISLALCRFSDDFHSIIGRNRFKF